MTHKVSPSADEYERRKESDDMEDTNTFLGAKRGTIIMVGVIVAIGGPTLTMIATVIGLFSMMNSSINRLDDNITALRAEQKADLDALRAEQKADLDALRAEQKADFDALSADFDALNADVDALSADVVELKLETTEIRVRVAEIERRLPEIESVDGRLDELESEQALIKERLDALAASAE